MVPTHGSKNELPTHATDENIFSTILEIVNITNDSVQVVYM